MVKPYNFGQPPRFFNASLKDFAGVDFSSYPSEVPLNRSPDAVNVISSTNGIIEKRTGYGVFTTLPVVASIQTIFRHEFDMYMSLVPSGALPHGFVKKMMEIVQCGTYFYYRYDIKGNPSATWIKLAYNGITSADGKEFPQGNNPFHVVMLPDEGSGITAYKRIWFVGGGSDFVVKFTQGSIDPASFVITVVDSFREAFIPTTVIGRSPSGGGTPYENISIMTWMRKNSFIGEDGVTTYLLDATNIDAISTDNRHGGTISDNYSGKVKAEILQSDGTYSTIWEGAGLTVNRTTGLVTFSVAPGTSFIYGHDNIIITFSKNRGDYSRKVKEILTGVDPVVDESIYFYCTPFYNYDCFGQYGMNGQSNYLFAALSNRDYYIRLDDLYSPELGYTLFGTDQSRIMGYSIVDKYMVIHKENNKSETTLFVRSVDLDSNNEVIFPVTYGVPGVGAIAKGSFATLRDEPMYLSSEGVFGVVTSNITDIQSVQDRSYYVSKRLLQESTIASAKAISHDGKYYLSIGTKVYVADSRFKSYSDDDKSDSYQYDWFYWELSNSVVTWHTSEDRLFFGGTDGKIYRFKLDSEANPYLDVATAVSAYWCTPFMYFDRISQKKSLKNLWCLLAAHDKTGVEIYYRVKGEEKKVKEADIDLLIVPSSFTRLTLNTLKSQHIVVTNRIERQFMGIQFMFKNVDALPFGIIEIALKYQVNSDFKG